MQRGRKPSLRDRRSQPSLRDRRSQTFRPAAANRAIAFQLVTAARGRLTFVPRSQALLGNALARESSASLPMPEQLGNGCSRTAATTLTRAPAPILHPLSCLLDHHHLLLFSFPLCESSRLCAFALKPPLSLPRTALPTALRPRPRRPPPSLPAPTTPPSVTSRAHDARRGQSPQAHLRPTRTPLAACLPVTLVSARPARVTALARTLLSSRT